MRESPKDSFIYYHFSSKEVNITLSSIKAQWYMTQRYSGRSHPTQKRVKKESGKFICFNRDCKLRKQKTCRGFEGCPGFRGER